MLDPPLVPRTADPTPAEYEARIVYLLDLLNQERDLRHAHFEVLTEAILHSKRLEDLLENAACEIDRLRGEWSVVDDIARADLEVPEEEE